MERFSTGSRRPQREQNPHELATAQPHIAVTNPGKSSFYLQLTMECCISSMTARNTSTRPPSSGSSLNRLSKASHHDSMDASSSELERTEDERQALDVRSAVAPKKSGGIEHSGPSTRTPMRSKSSVVSAFI